MWPLTGNLLPLTLCQRSPGKNLVDRPKGWRARHNLFGRRFGNEEAGLIVRSGYEPNGRLANSLRHHPRASLPHLNIAERF